MYNKKDIEKKLIENYGEDHILYKLFSSLSRDKDVIKYFNNPADLIFIRKGNFQKFKLKSHDIANTTLVIFVDDHMGTIYYERKEEN